MSCILRTLVIHAQNAEYRFILSHKIERTVSAFALFGLYDAILRDRRHWLRLAW